MKLTPTQRAVLRGLRDHNDAFWHARGLQQHGGYAGSIKSLLRAGLLEYDGDWRVQMTEAGKAEAEAAR